LECITLSIPPVRATFISKDAFMRRPLILLGSFCALTLAACGLDEPQQLPNSLLSSDTVPAYPRVAETVHPDSVLPLPAASSPEPADQPDGVLPANARGFLGGGSGADVGFDVKSTRSSHSASSGYHLGPKGGCYTFTRSGKKRYVDHSYCN
jgi:hypothetical protein